MDIETVSVNLDQVHELLSTSESHFMDLKSVDITPASLSKTVSAFANTSGGEIYIGIEEVVGKKGAERVWRGFATPEDANAILQVMEGMSPLGNHYSAEFLGSDGQKGLVLHLTVLKTREIFHATNGKVFIRRGAQKLPVDAGEAIQPAERPLYRADRDSSLSSE